MEFKTNESRRGFAKADDFLSISLFIQKPFTSISETIMSTLTDLDKGERGIIYATNAQMKMKERIIKKEK
ncbi:MAG: hypothetical protein HC830_09795 [Bacteroidetes bacterium]|nr:hypothetical protein [Bacteroidota bacterium]